MMSLCRFYIWSLIAFGLTSVFARYPWPWWIALAIGLALGRWAGSKQGKKDNPQKLLPIPSLLFGAFVVSAASVGNGWIAFLTLIGALIGAFPKTAKKIPYYFFSLGKIFFS